MISQQKANQIGQQWIEAWNMRDLDAIVAHYADDVEFTSPFVVKLLGNPDGTIRGKEKLRDYFAKGLVAYPELKFDLLQVLVGVESVTLYYRSVKELLAAEVMILNSQDLVMKVMVHYSGMALS